MVKLLDLQNEYEVLSAKNQEEGNKIKLKQELQGIQKGKLEDKLGWTSKVVSKVSLS